MVVEEMKGNETALMRSKNRTFPHCEWLARISGRRGTRVCACEKRNRMERKRRKGKEVDSGSRDEIFTPPVSCRGKKREEMFDGMTNSP